MPGILNPEAQLLEVTFSDFRERYDIMNMHLSLALNELRSGAKLKKEAVTEIVTDFEMIKFNLQQMEDAFKEVLNRENSED